MAVTKEEVAGVKKARFHHCVGFHDALKRRVHEYFAEKGVPQTGDWRVFLKTGIILAGFAGAYALLVFGSTSWIVAAVAALAVAQGSVLIGFNVMHDGAHGSYSRNRKVNWTMGFMLDMIGGSHIFWRRKHNLLHHTYTNIHELDPDICTQGVMRLSPDQTWHFYHRFQHLYAFPIYSLLTLSLVTFSDFHKFFSGRIGSQKIHRPALWESVLFFLMKAFYFGYALVLPCFFHPPLYVFIAFLGVHMILGLTFATVFQLAHAVEGNTFPRPDARTGEMENEWAIHEVDTTANFAPRSRLAAWYLGGLNFQIEHHLFPKVCHVHYPAISKIVEETCREFAIPYTCYPTVWSAVKSHYQFLKSLGRQR